MASILWNGRVGFLESGRRKYQFDCISAERGRRLRSSRAACARCVEWIGRFRCVGLGGQGPRSASAATGRGQETEARGWRTEDRGRRTEARGQGTETEDRGRRTGDGGRRTGDGGRMGVAWGSCPRGSETATRDGAACYGARRENSLHTTEQRAVCGLYGWTGWGFRRCSLLAARDRTTEEADRSTTDRRRRITAHRGWAEGRWF